MKIKKKTKSSLVLGGLSLGSIGAIGSVISACGIEEKVGLGDDASTDNTDPSDKTNPSPPEPESVPPSLIEPSSPVDPAPPEPESVPPSLIEPSSPVDGTITNEIVTSEIATKIFNGTASQAELFTFMDSVAPGDVIGGVNQKGIAMPSKAWSELIAPQFDALPTQINAPFIDSGLSNDTIANFGNEDLEFVNIAFIQDNLTEEVTTGQLAGVIKTSEPQFENIIKNINTLRNRGGDAILSFGGASGTPIWRSINDPILLGTYYYLLAKEGNFHAFDFDIEGGDQLELDGIHVNSLAIKLAQDKLESEGWKLDVNLTLPVLPTGITGDATKVIEIFRDNGVKINTINIMNFDYGDFEGTSLEKAKQSIENTQIKIAEIFGVSEAEAYRHIGTTHMPLVDDQEMPWTTEDAHALVEYAMEKQLNMLSFWSLTPLVSEEANAAAPEHLAAFNVYNEAPKTPLTPLYKSDSDIYSQGTYNYDIAVEPWKPASEIEQWVPGKSYAMDQQVRYTIDGKEYIFKAKWDSPSAPTQLYNSDSTSWDFHGSVEEYIEFHDFLTRIENEKAALAANNPYYFISHDGVEVPGFSNRTDYVKEWFSNPEHIMDWQNGITATTGELYRYNGEIWFTKWFTQDTPSLEGGFNAQWKIYEPDKDKAVFYWDIKTV